MTRVYLGLGSNMGDRQNYLKKAIAALDKLPNTDLVALSSLYETKAWGVTEQADFLNCVCQLETALEPQELLRCCQAIENSLDRVRQEHWGPRTVDIDILLYGEQVIDEENLKVPHPFMAERAFVLVPLAELSETIVHPLMGETVQTLLVNLGSEGVRPFEP